MKVFIALIVVIGAASALGSGPYLPRGWRPQGPAFYLPSELPKPSDSPLKESLLQEVEASGSDALREYGAPKFKEVTLSVDQDLPDVATEHTFYTQINTEEGKAVEKTSNDEANTELAEDIGEASIATESAATESAQTELPSADIVQSEPTSEPFQCSEVKSQQENVVPAVIVVEKVVTTITGAVIEQDSLPTATVTKVTVPLDLAEDTVLPTGSEDAVVPVSEQESTQDASPTAAEVEVAVPLAEDIIPTAVSEATVVPVSAQDSIQDVSPTAAVVEVFVPLGEDTVPSAVSEQAVEPSSEQVLVQDALSNAASKDGDVLSLEMKPIVVAEEDSVSQEVQEPEKETIASPVSDLDIEVQADDTTKTASTQETNSLQGEGFLEYGPPGFKEYGPPKQEESTQINVAEEHSENDSENNEVRKRRFSPRLRYTKRQ